MDSQDSQQSDFDDVNLVDENFYSVEELMVAAGVTAGNALMNRSRRQQPPNNSGPEIPDNSKPAENSDSAALPVNANETGLDCVDTSISESPSGSGVSATDGNEVFCGNLSENRKRSKRPNVKTWSQQAQKAKRMKGDEYLGFQKVSDATTSQTRRVQTKTKAAKVLKPGCTSSLCLKSKSRHCEQFNETTRKILFNNFWNNMDWGQKRAYVLSLVDQIPKKRSRNGSEVSRRSETFLYFLKLDGQKRQVCLTMFLSTLGLGRNQLHNWVKNKRITRQERSKESYRRRDGKEEFLRKFLSDLPKLPSHYCRKSTSKEYLEPLFTTKSQLYSVYRTFCKEKKVPPMSSWKLDSLVDEMNIGIFQPKKDQCDTCCGHTAGTISDHAWNVHMTKKNMARDEKTSDKKDAIDQKCNVLTMDVQAVKLSPHLKASALYYKMKLAVHNFTIYDLSTHNARCYLWDETEGELVASVFASNLVEYLEEKYQDDLKIIIYSDGCTYQNRNAIMSTALLDHAVKKNKTIIQKYLEKGHTQMEVDSVHSAIECRLKCRDIMLPTDYIKICVDARKKPEPYEVKYLNHKNFKDFSSSSQQRYPSIRPGIKTGDPCVSDLRGLRYNPNGTIDYKLNYVDDWKPLPKPKTTREISTAEFPPLYSSRLPINKRKYNDLQDLLIVIPEEFHAYYKNLPKKSC